MGKPRKPKSIQAPDTSDLFSLSLKLGDKVFESSGATVLEALTKLPRPQKIAGKGFLTVTHGDKKKEMFFWPLRLKRLFYSPTSQAIQAKSLALGLK